MECNFRGAIEPDRNDRGASANGCIANHVTVLPCARTHMTWKNRIQGDRDPAGKADLPTMGVSAEEQAKVGIGSLLIDLRRMRQQDGKIPERDSGRSLLNIIDAIKMRIINTG